MPLLEATPSSRIVVVSSLAGILTRAGVAARYRAAGVSAKDLAEHRDAASSGVKHATKTRALYRSRRRVALKIVLKS